MKQLNTDDRYLGYALSFFWGCALLAMVLSQPIKLELISPVSAHQLPSPTPTPLPAQTTVLQPYTPPQVASKNEIEAYIETVFGRYATQAKKVAFCESSLNPYARHSTSTATGLFQFTSGTWKWVRGLMGRNPSLELRTDPKESIDTAYKLFSLYGFNSTASWRASYLCWKI